MRLRGTLTESRPRPQPAEMRVLGILQEAAAQAAAKDVAAKLFSPAGPGAPAGRQPAAQQPGGAAEPLGGADSGGGGGGGGGSSSCMMATVGIGLLSAVGIWGAARWRHNQL